MALSFKERKERRLNGPDLSRKKSIDKHIKHLVELINKEEVYCTASSCSGRVVLVARTDTEDGQVQKKGCKWLLVSHNVVDWNDFVGHLRNKEGSIVMKFEPMIMHVQCATLTDAQKLHATSLASGFKNSGLTISNSGNITLAIRSTHTLEVPLSKSGVVLVSDEYVKFIVGEANKKMFENQKRIERFTHTLLMELLSTYRQITGFSTVWKQTLSTVILVNLLAASFIEENSRNLF
ncbi:tRNA wybutosine-synthesizing protein 3 homolog isoform X2 [Tachypleus tridentatus]|uniref:tRNA wybutosine-synthesizing protein 3 homolog isoform X2 n=1 Tax=Tachypleus tridentatus TaxID=6853 RepID=UPI003FD3864D